ncbi:MAG: hypothetical protein COB46_10010 [Rhodospirillaceae bacterium]|nr:MAG: hypothetical protein COB46_10010 [Rhodospirillaceae bacterium]
MNIWILLAGINAAMAVGMGAYGWHALGDTPDIRDVFMMGSQYQMWHGMALLMVGIISARFPHKSFTITGILFQAGIVLFVGTLYSFGGLMIVPVTGAAPVGGGLLILGWLILGVQGARHFKS